MERTPVTATVPGGELVGWRQGSGQPVLLLHGGPGLSFEYLDELADDLGQGYEVAAFQQRGLSPSTLDGPFTIDVAVRDVVAFLDALGWSDAYVLGHSWGGHLLLYVLAQQPRRVRAAMAVDPLGAAGDGGNGAFEAAMDARTPEADRQRARELDERAMSGEGTEADSLESLSLYWPAYFADPALAPPMPPLRVTVEAYASLFAELLERMPSLAASLPAIDVPLAVVVGELSPMPPTEAGLATAAAVPGAWAVVVEGAGHFPWYERPGAIREAMLRLTSSA
jgi:pimeloyl-ACP methyl ester carboxylesterase